MVHSRSATNLNRILLDLCTSPDVRRKHSDQERQYHLPLPVFKTSKSNSCPNIEESLPPLPSSLSFDNDQDLSVFPPAQSTAVPLAPIESMGFAVQTTATALAPCPSLKLFAATPINQPQPPAFRKTNSQRNEERTAAPSPISQSLQQDDFVNRLQNRWKSREHLRKFFLS